MFSRNVDELSSDYTASQRRGIAQLLQRLATGRMTEGSQFGSRLVHEFSLLRVFQIDP
jgi:hypothetical protein